MYFTYDILVLPLLFTNATSTCIHSTADISSSSTCFSIFPSASYDATPPSSPSCIPCIFRICLGSAYDAAASVASDTGLTAADLGPKDADNIHHGIKLLTKTLGSGGWGAEG